MEIVYFDACTDNDYDSIVRFLLEKQCPMAKRNKMDKSLAAKISQNLLMELMTKVTFEDLVTHGNKPLDHRNTVAEDDEWSKPDPAFLKQD